MGNTGTFIKQDIICKEQQYINLYKPVINLNPAAGSSMGFKHSEESKRLISEFRKGKPLSEKTKIRLSTLFSDFYCCMFHQQGYRDKKYSMQQ